MKIIHTPNPVLITPTKEVAHLDRKVKEIIADMNDALMRADEPKGVGLAATQVGINLRIFLMRPEDEGPISVHINPRYISKSKSMVKGIPGSDHRLEGCLSIPRVWGIVKRHKEVEIEYMNEEGKIINQHFTDFPAIIVQHEIDHLDGILFPRRVVEQKGKLYQGITNEKGEEELEPLEI